MYYYHYYYHYLALSLSLSLSIPSLPQVSTARSTLSAVLGSARRSATCPHVIWYIHIYIYTYKSNNIYIYTSYASHINNVYTHTYISIYIERERKRERERERERDVLHVCIINQLKSAACFRWSAPGHLRTEGKRRVWTSLKSTCGGLEYHSEIPLFETETLESLVRKH